MLDYELGEYIRKKRKEKDYTLKELGEEIGFSDGYISMVENGKKKNPSFEFLVKLSNVFDEAPVRLLYLGGHVGDFPQSSNPMLEDLFDHLDKEVKNIDDLDNHEDLALNTAEVSTYIPIMYEYKDSNGVTIRKGIREGKEEYDLRGYLFDLHYLLNARIPLRFNGGILSEKEKEKIFNFIKDYIIE